MKITNFWVIVRISKHCAVWYLFGLVARNVWKSVSFYISLFRLAIIEEQCHENFKLHLQLRGAPVYVLEINKGCIIISLEQELWKNQWQLHIGDTKYLFAMEKKCSWMESELTYPGKSKMIWQTERENVFNHSVKPKKCAQLKIADFWVCMLQYLEFLIMLWLNNIT